MESGTSREPNADSPIGVTDGSPSPAFAALDSRDPSSIGPYRLIGRLGAGGMGVVYLAEHPTGIRYALKALAGSHRMDAELRTRLAREARSLTAIDSPHVVQVVDVDSAAEVPYIVMTYVEGVGLDRAVPEGGLSTAAVLEYGSQLAGAVEHVHAKGILHRDLKPTNVVLGAPGVTLVDFGIASLDEGTTALTRQGTFLGSLAWMAPEVIQGGSADEASDTFALGLVLGFMALGRNPFGAGRPEVVMYRIIHEEPDLDSCDPTLVPIIESALAKDPARRVNARQMRQALEARLEQRTQLELQNRLDRQAERIRRDLEQLKARQELQPPQRGAAQAHQVLRVGDCVLSPMADDIVVVPSSDPHQGEVVFVDAAFYEGDSAPPSDRGDAALISNRTASTIEADSPEDVDDPSPDPHSVLHPGGRPSLKGGGRRLLITASTVTVIALIGAAVHGLVGRESVAANDAATDGSGAEPISVPSPMHTGVPATLEDDTTGVVPRADNTAGRLPNSLSRSSSGDAAATSVPGGEPVVPGGEPVVPGGEPVVPGEPAAPVSGVSAVSATLNDKDQVVLRWSFDAGKGAEPYMFIIESSDGTMVAHTNGYGIRSGLLPAPPAGTSIAYCVYPAADDYGPDGQPVKIGLGACSNTITVGA